MPLANSPHGDLEKRYYAYLRAQELSSTDALLAVLGFYLPYFQGYQRVLDMGCGHGEFLDMLAAAGHDAVGVDVDPGMVAACRAKGLEVEEADVLAWLPAQAGRFDAIFSSNVMEHLPAPVVAQVIRAAFAALRPGGLLLIGVPNPESIVVQLHEFWRDATHVRLYSRQLLGFFLADAGFTQIQSGENLPARWEGTDGLAASLSAALHTQPAALIPAPQPEALPASVGAGASLRQRAAFRLGRFLYTRLLAPFLAPLGRDVAALRQSTAANLDHLAGQIQQGQANQQILGQQIQAVGQGVLFLHPSREVFVWGRKPEEATP